MSWLLLVVIIIIPMGFILAYSIQLVRRKQVEYSLSRALALGFIVAAVSFGLVEVATSDILLKLLKVIYSLV